MQIIYDDRKLEEFFAQLDPKRRKAALKGAMRRSSNKVKKRAAQNLKNGTGSNGKRINTKTGLAKGIRAVVYKKKAVGFRVTIGTKSNRKDSKKSKGFHTNRAGVTKPVLIWAEGGTKNRYTKSKTKVYIRKKSGHYTGRMPSYYFMKKTLNDTRDTVTDDIRGDIRATMSRLVKKYGSS